METNFTFLSPTFHQFIPLSITHPHHSCFYFWAFAFTIFVSFAKINKTLQKIQINLVSSLFFSKQTFTHCFSFILLSQQKHNSILMLPKQKYPSSYYIWTEYPHQPVEKYKGKQNSSKTTRKKNPICDKTPITKLSLTEQRRSFVAIW